MIRERTTAGLAAARARGRNGGGRQNDADKLKTAKDTDDSKEHTVAAIAKTIGVIGASVCRQQAV